MPSNMVSVSLPDEVMPVVRHLRSQWKFSSVVSKLLMGYGKAHKITKASS
jgi:hypothetical protein